MLTDDQIQSQPQTIFRHIRLNRTNSLLYLLYFSRTLLPSASSGQKIGRLSLTQLFTSVIGIPISLYHLGTSSSQRFRVLPLGRRPSGWITSALLWGAVGAILLMCDHHLILFLFAVCSAGCMFTRRRIYYFLIVSILVFPAAFLRHIISVVVNICHYSLMRVHFSFWFTSLIKKHDYLTVLQLLRMTVFLSIYCSCITTEWSKLLSVPVSWYYCWYLCLL